MQGSTRREHRTYFIPPLAGEAGLTGTEFEVRLRNRLTQRAIARECAQWIRDKVKFRSNVSGLGMQPMVAVDDVAYFPVSGFTTSALGYEESDQLSNVLAKFEGPGEAGHLLSVFDQVWNDPGKLEDVTQTVLSHIEQVYAENSPERVYYLILNSIFSEFLADLSEDVLPDDRTGYRETAVWNALYNFQRDAAESIINKLEFVEIAPQELRNASAFLRTLHPKDDQATHERRVLQTFGRRNKSKAIREHLARALD